MLAIAAGFPAFLEKPSLITMHRGLNNHDAIEAGFKQVLPNATYVKLPMADGGEGTVQSLVDATGGRILHHLKAFAPDPRNTIVVTGYQVPGTRGASIAAGERDVRIHGEWIPINAQVASLKMMSAHADADELLG